MSCSRLACFLATVLLGALPGKSAMAAVIAGSELLSPPPFFQQSFWAITSSIDRAFPFTVIPGGSFLVDELQVAIFRYPNQPGHTAVFSLHEDANGEPGAELAAFQFQAIGLVEQVRSAMSTTGVTLDGGGSYWIVGQTGQGQVNWIHGGNSIHRANGPAAYRFGSEGWTFLASTSISAFAVLGRPVPEPSTAAFACLAMVAPLVLRSRVAGGRRGAASEEHGAGKLALRCLLRAPRYHGSGL